MSRSIFKRVVPRRLARLLRDVGRLESSARWTYIRLGCQRWFGRNLPKVLPAERAVTLVTICHGNILRSAFAEARLHQAVATGRLPDSFRISSAGMHAWPGKAADPRGVVVAREMGTDLTRHRARLLDDAMVAGADVLLVMDRLNEAELLSRYPSMTPKVLLLGEFDAASAGDPAIEDPYTGGPDAVRESFSRIAAAVDGLVTSLGKRQT